MSKVNSRKSLPRRMANESPKSGRKFSLSFVETDINMPHPHPIERTEAIQNLNVIQGV